MGALRPRSPFTRMMKITDPRSPELLAWLESLAPMDRLAARMGLTHAFTWLSADKAWKAETAALLESQMLTGRQIEDLLVRSAAIGASLTDQAPPDDDRTKRSAPRRPRRPGRRAAGSGKAR